MSGSPASAKAQAPSAAAPAPACTLHLPQGWGWGRRIHRCPLLLPKPPQARALVVEAAPPGQALARGQVSRLAAAAPAPRKAASTETKPPAHAPAATGGLRVPRPPHPRTRRGGSRQAPAPADRAGPRPRVCASPPLPATLQPAIRGPGIPEPRRHQTMGSRFPVPAGLQSEPLPSPGVSPRSAGDAILQDRCPPARRLARIPDRGPRGDAPT